MERMIGKRTLPKCQDTQLQRLRYRMLIDAVVLAESIPDVPSELVDEFLLRASKGLRE